MSGRIAYKKVLGEKNPADLLTKYMSADLMNKHLETISARAIVGRAESAPQIDTLSNEGSVVSWRQTWIERKVSFCEEVEVRPIPSTGKGRSCKSRQSRAARWQQPTAHVEVLAHEETNHVKVDEVIKAGDEKTAAVNVQEDAPETAQKVGPHTCGIGGTRSRGAN